MGEEGKKESYEGGKESEGLQSTDIITKKNRNIERKRKLKGERKGEQPGMEKENK